MGTVHEGLGGAFTNPGVSWMKLARSAWADGWRRTDNGYGAAAIDAGAAIARAGTSQGSLRGMPGRERMGALSEHEQEEVERKVRRSIDLREHHAAGPLRIEEDVPAVHRVFDSVPDEGGVGDPLGTGERLRGDPPERGIGQRIIGGR